MKPAPALCFCSIQESMLCLLEKVILLRVVIIHVIHIGQRIPRFFANFYGYILQKGYLGAQIIHSSIVLGFLISV